MTSTCLHVISLAKKKKKIPCTQHVKPCSHAVPITPSRNLTLDKTSSKSVLISYLTDKPGLKRVFNTPTALSEQFLCPCPGSLACCLPVAVEM